ncbi:hypothetical protein QD47_09715 [Paenibacillus terrae]|uniref:PIN like domain-containing protein n=1 Tax=Paenibacillus terrae TaxID=159743 RepID=A0A0D7X2X4_9BACL|nr:hypothetical protein QD47_09715 [Paenibacillus terrae]
MNLLEGIIGEPYPQDKINIIEKEGGERYKYSVPPGFKDKDDKNKLDYRTYGDFRYQQLYGDLIVWNQMIDRAKTENNPTSIIFITEEKKEDWWEKDDQNKIRRPHPQLIQEFYNKTNQNFYMYRTESFVKFAKEYLDADVTDEQVENVAKDMEQIRRSEEKEYVEVIHDFYNDNSELISNVSVSELLKYLSANEEKELKSKIQQALNDIESKEGNISYNRAIKWAMNQSVPLLEKKSKELAAEIALIDYAKAQEYINILNLLPKNPFNRGTALLNSIRNMQHYLWEQELPF